MATAVIAGVVVRIAGVVVIAVPALFMYRPHVIVDAVVVAM
jgi:hypothetical protein